VFVFVVVVCEGKRPTKAGLPNQPATHQFIGVEGLRVVIGVFHAIVDHLCCGCVAQQQGFRVRKKAGV